ncbi:MAG: hypothetical protein FWD25_01845 [Clostridia bacterium]|nr:hypothetical protein [Clostridia bacterium]
MKKTLSVLLAFTLVLALHTSALAVLDADALFQTIVDSMEGLESFSFTLTDRKNIRGESSSAVMTGIKWTDPVRTTGILIFSDPEYWNLAYYAEVIDRQMVYYLDMYGVWIKTSEELTDFMMLNDYDQTLAIGDSTLEKKAEPWAEPIQGREVNKLTLAIDFLSLADAHGVYPWLQEFIPSLAAVQQHQDLPPMLFYYYLDVETGEILRIERDLSALVTELISIFEPTSGGSPAEHVSVMNIWDINAIEEFEIPDEVRAATPI